MKIVNLVFLCLLAVGDMFGEDSKIDVNEGKVVQGNLVSELYKEIAGAPTWNYREFEAGQDRVLLQSLSKLQYASTEQVREVVARLMATEDKSQFENTWFKVYLINRLIFDISADVSWRDVPRVKGGIGSPFDIDAAIWPLIIKADGTLRIASRSAGYAGPAYYQGLAEFEAFARVFKRRDLSKYSFTP